MATMDQLVDNKDIQPLRPTTLSQSPSSQMTKELQEIWRKEQFIREVGAPNQFRISGAPSFINKKKDQDDYELKKLAWIRMHPNI